MSAKKSEFLSAFGKAFQIFKAIVDAVKERGGSDEQIGKILTVKELRDGIADLVMKFGGAVKDAFHVIVNYGLSLDAMIKEGKYGWVSDNITEKHFPLDHTRGIADADVELINFNRYMESDDAVRELDEMGFRSIDLPKLLAFAKAYPEKQREFPIAALGSVWRDLGGRYVTSLSSTADRRELSLVRWSGGWSADFRFAAVRK